MTSPGGSRPRLSLIVAMSESRVIGVRNSLPWSLPGDLKRFRAITTGHPVIMGRKTFKSIGKPLPNRTNIVISRNPKFYAEGVMVATTLDEALAMASIADEGSSPEEREVFVIGGAEIYRLALPRAHRLYVTWVHRDFEGDAWFPEWESDSFHEVSREEHLQGPLPHSYVVLEKCKKAQEKFNSPGPSWLSG